LPRLMPLRRAAMAAAVLNTNPNSINGHHRRVS